MNENIIEFKKYAKPYCEKYIKLNGQWRRHNKHLHDSMIEQTMASDTDVYYGFIGASRTQMLLIDIDFHHKESHKRESKLFAVSTISDHLGAEPSFVWNSPRGAHLYYLFTNDINTKILIRAARARLSKMTGYGATISYDLRPSMDAGIRIPKDGRYDELPEIAGFADAVKLAKEKDRIYNVVTLFPEIYSYDKRVQYKADKAEKKLDEWISIENGETNEALCDLIPAMKRAGYSQEEAANAFIAKLDSNYTGDVRNSLHRRIRWFYNNTYDTISVNESKDFYFIKETEPQDKAIYDFFMEEFKYKKPQYQKRTALRYYNFVVGVIKYCSFLDSVYENPIKRAEFNHYYPYFIYQMKSGAYPLPQSVLEKIDGRYSVLMDKVVQVGFLKDHNDSKYKVGVSCKSYNVDISAIKATITYSALEA